MRKGFQPQTLAESLEGCAKALHQLAVSYDSGHRSSMVIEAAALIEQTAVMFRKGEAPSEPTGSNPLRPSRLATPTLPPSAFAASTARQAPKPRATEAGVSAFWRNKRAAAAKAAR